MISIILKRSDDLSKSHLNYLVLASLMPLLSGIACDSEQPVENDASVESTDIQTVEDRAEPEQEFRSQVIAEPNDAASYLFAEDIIRTYELRLSKEDLAFLDADPQAEEYVEGELVFEGQTISPVGIRYKGSVGAFVGCAMGFQNNSFGHKSCPKLSMKVKINWSDPDALFYGVRKLQFHAMNPDDSLMREQLGYHVYRAMGIAAPRTAYVRLLVNGEFEGLFLLVKQIDGRFTRSHFVEGGKGNLYKEVWPIHDNPKPYQNALRTNEDENPSFDRPLALASDLSNAAPEELPAVVAYWMDIEYSLRYVAVDRTLGQNDGPMHWYCGLPVAQGNNLGAYGNHNYYWYEEMDRDRFWIIPWDLDIILGGNPSTRLTTPWNSRQPKCKGCSPFGGQRPAACDPLIYTWGGIPEPYEQAVQELISGPFSAEVVDELLDKWSEQIESTVIEAAKFRGELQVNAWTQGVKRLRNVIARQREQMSSILVR